MRLALKAEDISKQYRLGQVGTGTISHDLNRFWHQIRGKENPYLKIGEVNDRTTKGNSDYVWSLKDINFEIEQGDAVGIIGRNGAGKSTLLKLLSKVTKPTTGKIYTNGRIASLLEVGTGFHPEMTGRENVFLNGAILGMTRKEITRKFDEIVDFSGVEKYIDTPVKRYSSGMYVRLAFAVAAHLESEVLIVDEVLAVGDLEFQKKCLGKMGDVSKGEGRTVLFVSHNMAAVKKLCNNGIFLENGNINSIDNVDNIISEYVSVQDQKNLSVVIGNKKTELKNIELLDSFNAERNTFFMNEPVKFRFTVKFNEDYNNLDFGITIKDNYDQIVGHLTNMDEGFVINGKSGEEKTYIIEVAGFNFTPNSYNLNFGIVDGSEWLYVVEDYTRINILKDESFLRPGDMPKHVMSFYKSNWKEI